MRSLSFLSLLLLALALTAKERIVTLGPAVTNQLLLLGIDDEIVGKTSYCDSSAGSPDEVVEVGSLLTLSLESIVSLNPSIVFASGLTPPAVQNKLTQFGIAVIEIEDPSSYEMLCQNFSTIGKAVGKTEVADSILEQSLVIHAQLMSDLETVQSKRVFIELASKPLYTIVKGSLGDELISLIGGDNIFDLRTSGEVSRESVVQNNPEVILISDMGIAALDEKEKWLSFTTLAASEDQNIHVIDAYKIGSPTVVSFLETVVEIREIIGFGSETN